MTDAKRKLFQLFADTFTYLEKKNISGTAKWKNPNDVKVQKLYFLPFWSFSKLSSWLINLVWTRSLESFDLYTQKVYEFLLSGDSHSDIARFDIQLMIISFWLDLIQEKDLSVAQYTDAREIAWTMLLDKRSLSALLVQVHFQQLNRSLICDAVARNNDQSGGYCTIYSLCWITPSGKGTRLLWRKWPAKLGMNKKSLF